MLTFLRALFRRRRPGRHRPETVVPVGDLYLIAYPNLYQRYLPYVQRYGYGAEQAAHWVWRKTRLAELLAARDERQRWGNYRWMAVWEPTTEMPAVTA